MESVRKLYFDPLLTSKLQVRQLVASLPPGSAHPYSPDRVLLCNAPNGVQEIDISSYDEEFFYNAVDLGEMGEILLKRMSKFSQLSESSHPAMHYKQYLTSVNNNRSVW